MTLKEVEPFQKGFIRCLNIKDPRLRFSIRRTLLFSGCLPQLTEATFSSMFPLCLFFQLIFFHTSNTQVMRFVLSTNVLCAWWWYWEWEEEKKNNKTREKVFPKNIYINSFHVLIQFLFTWNTFPFAFTPLTLPDGLWVYDNASVASFWNATLTKDSQLETSRGPKRRTCDSKERLTPKMLTWLIEKEKEWGPAQFYLVYL